MAELLPVGKLPPDLLARLLADTPQSDPRIRLGPAIGLDCAVIDLGTQLLVFKSDPITFATEAIGWYAVAVNSNDIATTGAIPRWFLVTLLLPEGSATPKLASEIMVQLGAACRRYNISLIGGHTEVTAGLERVIVAGTMVGEVQPGKLITPQGARPGDRLILTKGVPIEGAAIAAREFRERLREDLSTDELNEAAGYLMDPGISVLRDAQVAVAAGRVTAMHDPTEGGLAAALWEMATASKHGFVINPARIPIPAVAGKICQSLGLNPLATIASGALLLTTGESDAADILMALKKVGIEAEIIGYVVDGGPPAVWEESNGERTVLPLPERDEIARLFERG